jgi:sulfite reductase (NADPH) flavoprotein alpha-component
VASLLEEMKWDEETLVTINKEGDTFPLKEAQTTYFEITLLSKKILQQAVEFTEIEELQAFIK